MKGKRVLELGAGIGRFTGELCKAGASHVVAMDFMEASIEENRKTNGHFGNVEFRCALLSLQTQVLYVRSGPQE